MKKVIFIGGSSYSGSTMLDMVLSNDKKGLSLGEIYAIKYPFRNHHIQKRTQLIKIDPRWQTIMNGSVNEFYLNIFKMFPQQDFIVDSSKNPVWIFTNNKILKKHGIGTHNILIYKTPLEIASSFKKRKRGDEWIKSWVNYHRSYFSLIDNFKTISYKDFVSDEKQLMKICRAIEIPYTEEKFKFWDKKQPTLFGNNRTRYHTFKEEEELSKFTQENSGIYEISEYRKIYYNEITDSKLINNVAQIQKKKPQIKQILSYLSNSNISNEKNKIEILSNMKFTKFEIFLRKLKMKVNNQFYRTKELLRF